MSAERLKRLELLLGRVQKNARSSREEPAALAPVSAPPGAVADEFLDESGVIDLAPRAKKDEAPASSRRVATSMDEAFVEAADQLEDEPKTIPPESGPELLTPTTEQLGQTVSLPEGSGAELDLDEPLSESVYPPSEEPQLEAELPTGAGAYSADLAPPPEAREELERVRLGQVEAEVIVRPVISTNVVEFLEAHAEKPPESFVALLDAALALGHD